MSKQSDFQEVNFDIFGSCVTRDAFEYRWESEHIRKVNTCVSRCSLLSLYSEPSQIPEIVIDGSTKWEDRNVIQDFTKSFFNEIDGKESQWIIIDFIDERNPVIEKNGKRGCPQRITASVPFSKSGIIFEGVTLSLQERRKLFKDVAKKFATDLLAHYSKNRIIIHRAIWADRTIMDNGIVSYDRIGNYSQETISLQNAALKEYYDALQMFLPQSPVINIDEVRASEKHIWGPAPFHYEDDYYRQFNKQLKCIVEMYS